MPLNQAHERTLGLTHVAGVDEVGRGTWAGPIVAAAVIMPLGQLITGVRDSKKVAANRRTQLAMDIVSSALAIGYGVVAATDIDQIGINAANHLAMQQALDQLHPRPQHVFVDAMSLPDYPIPQTAVIKGDATVYAIAAASIIAKAYRDQLMAEYDAEFPGYNFASHKGYGTMEHRNALERLGPCVLHRLSFQPMAKMVL